MTLSKKLANAISDALEKDDPEIIQNALDTYNWNSQVVLKYDVVRELKHARPEWVKRFTNSTEQLSAYKNRINENQVPKTELVINNGLIKKIIDNQNKGIFNQVEYLLLVSGRRTNEILEKSFEVRDGRFYIEISKKKVKTMEPIMLLNNDADDFAKRLLNIRQYTIYKQSLGRHLQAANGINPHMLRAIYAALAFKFRNPERINNGSFLKQILNQDSNMSEYYSHIVLSGDVIDPFPTVVDLTTLSYVDLKKVAKEAGIKGAYKMKKAAIMELLQPKEEEVAVVEPSKKLRVPRSQTVGK